MSTETELRQELDEARTTIEQLRRNLSELTAANAGLRDEAQKLRHEKHVTHTIQLDTGGIAKLLEKALDAAAGKVGDKKSGRPSGRFP